MQVELVRSTTADGMFLDGALSAHTLSARTLSGGASSAADVTNRKYPQIANAFDGVLMLHGVGSNFYQPRLLAGLAETLDQVGLRTLRCNTRGHDTVHTVGTTTGAIRQGSAFEIVRECLQDIDSWIDVLQSRGCKSILLLGHSLGAIKAIYWGAKREHAAVAGLAALSPPRLSAAAFATSSDAAKYADSLQRAENQIAAGRSEDLLEVSFPFPMAMSAATYVDKYGGERYNILRLVGKLRLPTLFTYGERELSGGAFAGLPEQLRQQLSTEALSASTTVEVLPGADHSYSGHVDPILRAIDRAVAVHA